MGGRQEQEGWQMADKPRQETARVVFRQFLVGSGKSDFIGDIFVLNAFSLQMLCLIGESFDAESALVNGAVVNVRNRVRRSNS